MSDTPLPPNRPELLSPAGDEEAMRAAVANGADAVYFGLSNFNARHRAVNFTAERLPETMRWLHERNVRGYLALNTLIFSDELEQVAELVKSAAAAGVDAIIVQDLGLARLIHAIAPTLPIHGSTQMTLTEPGGIEFVRRLGVQRVILARELSLVEIAKIHAGTDVPVEMFIHGALCVAYSGQCLTSESLGGRSANRGQCAQACRLPYDLVVDGEPRDLGDRSYLLSPQDLAAHDLVGQLAAAGAIALKIEGRLKSAHYVAAATQTYRAAIDEAAAGRRYSIPPQQKADLEQSFSRGFTHGFLDGVDHQALVHARFPKSRGIRIGTVVDKRPGHLLVELDRSADARQLPLKPGDGVVFDEGHPEQDEQGGRLFAVSPYEQHGPRVRLVELALSRGDVNTAAIAPGSLVWKTDDPAMRKRLEQSYSREEVVHRVPLDVRVEGAIGRLLRITARSAEGHEAAVEWDRPLERAQKHPLTVELLREQFSRLGQTPYELRDLSLECPDPVMVPKSVLNDLRRQATEQLLGQRRFAHPIADADALRRLREVPSPQSAPGAPGEADEPCLTVLVRTLSQLQAAVDWRQAAMVYCDFEDVRQHRQAVEIARTAGVPIALATLRVVKPSEHGLLRQLAECAPDAVLVRNLAAIAFYSANYPHLPLLGDYSLNIANELTAQVFAEAGLRRMVPSYDLNWPQLEAMLQRFPPAVFEAVLHQHMPMFHMEHCVFAHVLSSGKDHRDCGRPCERHAVDLRDRVGQSHPLIPDVGCRNTLYNATAQTAAEYLPRMLRLGIRHFRVELLRETPEQATAMLNRYARLLRGEEEPRSALRSLRVLHQLGVTAGTLDHE